MTDPHEPEAQPSDELQFENAEFTATPPGSLMCAACSREVAGSYYELNGKVICEPCRNAILAHREGGSGLVRFARAFIFGSLASFIGFAIYFGVAKATGWEIGIIAVLVGFMVGSAVRAGSRHRGGWIYQLLAVFLTYSAVVATYSSFAIPALMAQQEEQEQAKEAEAEKILAQLEKDAKQDDGAKARDGAQAKPRAEAGNPGEEAESSKPADRVQDPAAKPEADLAAKTDDKPAAAAAKDEPKNDKDEPKEAGPAEVAGVPPGAKGVAGQPGARPLLAPPGKVSFVMVVLALGAVIGFLYSVPILVGIQSPISLFIVGFALWEAWKLNRRVPIVFNGPFDAGAGHSHPAAGQESHG